MPIGYLAAVALVAWCTLFALFPSRPRRSSPKNLSYWFAYLVVAHGDRDTLVLVEDARLFVERLRDASSNPGVYAELPGGHHTFDLFHFLRFEAVVDGIEAFAASVRYRR
jgi:acetyl esterase/lipase